MKFFIKKRKVIESFFQLLKNVMSKIKRYSQEEIFEVRKFLCATFLPTLLLYKLN